MDSNWLTKGISDDGFAWHGPTDPNGRNFATCFLVAPQLILTNHHVFGEPEDTTGIRIQFNYREQYGGTLIKPDEYTCDSNIFITDKALDFTLVGLTQQATPAYLHVHHNDRTTLGTALRWSCAAWPPELLA
jgi:hypothetical protein